MTTLFIPKDLSDEIICRFFGVEQSILKVIVLSVSLRIRSEILSHERSPKSWRWRASQRDHVLDQSDDEVERSVRPADSAVRVDDLACRLKAAWKLSWVQTVW